MTMRRLIAVLAAFVVLFAGVAEAAPDAFAEFAAKYRCPIADRLTRMYDAGDPKRDADRFLVVTLLEHRHGYVQCRFAEGEHLLVCEAASGFYYDPPGAPRTMRLAPARIAALGRLGFSTDDSAGNFRLEEPVGQNPDFGAIADLMLHALFDAYDARVDKTLQFDAPFAPGLTLACDPVG